MATKQETQLTSASQQQTFTKLVNRNREFAFDIYRELCKESDGNVFFSPMSISFALAMTYLGAKANTAAEMKNTLKLSSLTNEEIHMMNRELTTYLQTDASSSYILKTASRIFARKDYDFQKVFLDAVKKFYKAQALTLDFDSDAEGSRQVINKWVEAQTADKIQNLLPGGSINAETAMVLVNAIYFKGRWKDTFEGSDTHPGKFKLGGKNEVDVDMMFRRDKMQYGEDVSLDCKIVELPYVNGDLSLFILLPNKEDGLSDLGKQVTHSKLADITTAMRSVDVELTLPKFKLDDEFSLNDVLHKLGMKDMFVSGKADFSGMDGTNRLYVSSVVHKSFIEVNEEGSEAAAATGVIMVLECCNITFPGPVVFKADHPFLFFIRDNRTKGILFMGHLANPL